MERYCDCGQRRIKKSAQPSKCGSRLKNTSCGDIHSWGRFATMLEIVFIFARISIHA